jgi:hypothetical protein
VQQDADDAGDMSRWDRGLGGPPERHLLPEGSSSYGHAGAGRYACRSEAEGVGMREIAN